MRTYEFKVIDIRGEVVIKGTFSSLNKYTATTKVIEKLGFFEMEEGDRAILTDIETGIVINTVRF